ncbi:hypothetical protein B0H14DRAFT_2667619 [Mycena olivaceomarginata]|nr:hypothetical protein B0H14DRAFT_2788307 [Mycena olivaceomarginata]KAJ7902765.1 hypothetical protein B0H14DRAFT_2667619 [Mycena olivaceomarginata]
MLSIMQINLVFFILQGPQTAALQQWQIIFMPRWVSLLYAVLPAQLDHMRSNTPAESRIFMSSVRAVLSFLLTRCLSRLLVSFLGCFGSCAYMFNTMFSSGSFGRIPK